MKQRYDIKDELRAFGAEQERADGPGDEGSDVDDWDDEEVDVKCLLSERRFTSVGDAVEHAKSEYGFDLHKIYADLKLDQYGLIRMVNYIRSEVAAGTSVADIKSHIYASSPCFLSDIDEDAENQDEGKMFLKPFLSDDPMLFFLDDVLGGEELRDADVVDAKASACEQEETDDDDDDVPELEEGAAGSGASGSSKHESGLASENRKLRQQLEEMENRLQQAKSIVGDFCAEDKKINIKDIPEQDNDSYYFDSYSHLVHNRIDPNMAKTLHAVDDEQQ
jgi:hypothetical protein